MPGKHACQAVTQELLAQRRASTHVQAKAPVRFGDPAVRNVRDRVGGHWPRSKSIYYHEQECAPYLKPYPLAFMSILFTNTIATLVDTLPAQAAISPASCPMTCLSAGRLGRWVQLPALRALDRGASPRQAHHS